MQYHPILSNPKLVVRQTRSVSLSEGLNDHATLVANILLPGGPRAALKALGAAVTWNLPAVYSKDPLFIGTVTDVQVHDDEVTLTAGGKTLERDRAQQTRSYGGGPRNTGIARLPNIKRVLKDVKGSLQLVDKVHHVFQCQESDWHLLIRLATRCGRAVRVSPTAVSLIDGAAQKPKPLLPSHVQPGTESLTLRGGVAGVASLAWDAASGAVPAEPETARAPKHPLWPGANGAVHQVFVDGFGDARPDARRAAQLARSQLAGALRWSGVVRLPTLTSGDVIKLPPGHVLSDPLVVVRRRLAYRPEADGADQLINSLECVPAGYGFRPGASGISPRALVSTTGQVADVNDPERLGRIKVNFPWQTRGGAQPTHWAGVWCQALHPFAGVDAQQRPHGSLNVPAVFDWVRVLLDPLDFGPPIVLGAVYRGNGKVPAHGHNPDKGRLLFHTADGLAVLAQAPDGGKPGSLTLLSADAASPEPRARIVLSDDGKVTIAAREAVEIRTKRIAVDTQETEHRGNFNVTRSN